MKLAPLALVLAAATPAAAQTAAPPPPPRLLVVISIDQFSADLFAEYRAQFSGGLKRLQGGAVFPSGYQSHAATETCPGHSTITTGMHPARTGIIANDWIDLKTTRTDKTVYCAEDESVSGSTSSKYTVSDKHLLVPTLGERMKAANPASRVVSVAGKDRAAVMMGGHRVDELWWWEGNAYRSYAGRAVPPVVARVNEVVGTRYAAPTPALPVPAVCTARERAIDVGGGKTVGTHHFARGGNDARLYRASPEFDGATLTLAAGLIRDMKLGQGTAPDIISVGASATDYVGHTYGSEGVEMCTHLLSLDRDLGDFFAVLDQSGIDYAVALTADHGGQDLPERLRENGMPTAERVDPALTAKTIGEGIAARLGLSGQLLWGGSFGDIWVDPRLTAAQRRQVIAEGVKAFAAHRQVEAVFTAEQIMAVPVPTTPPETWTLLQRARAGYNPQRSGAFVVALKPRVTPIADGSKGYVATHGSFWDYDRRVPILFWRKGMTPFEQPLSVETVDIAPTLAGLIGLPVRAGEMDGRCLDLVAGAGTSCPATN
ncbi:Predicted pyrophosphatase or phosphodiesterase, AlkP superfamily [Sphingomonas guangdongensis]|uniref:Alkaline phosphatase n=1 Tax=Sphingomonas guangdongensis TaxID=1141890 RepID=A0A285R129_9SPHN|nr:alkaline phosphatase family protein [Sphingomonas guangdongensis]SOB87429.1 Predicted pyrophosphatase or phosphodiesterase, AlkP superfamily [Sphingomonas guangdongensis]